MNNSNSKSIVSNPFFPLLTLEQAQAWNRTGEKFIFCTDILDAMNMKRCDVSVEAMEDAFEAILAVNGKLSGWDIHSLPHAEYIAESATKETGDLYIATDAGEHCHPRYDVIKAPQVGDEVSYCFNGDSYPCGVIASISKTMKKITTSDGKQFFRSKDTGAWVYNKYWSMVPGHIHRLNPEF